jgi:murein DD-endopeptidase MepM/ murein hydrolase activator NlpD
MAGCAIEPVPLDPPAVEAPVATLPTPPPITSRFGEWGGAGGSPRRWQHSGIDITARTGTPVLAAADGVVVRTGWGPYAGRYVLLRHGPDLGTAYYHLSVITVPAGQPVRRGDLIGRAGATGNATAPHLHFGVCRRPGGQCGPRFKDGWIDPESAWVAPNPCLVAGRVLPPGERSLTYPIPCAG